METIYFYHTNDIHSHFENWPQISRYLQDQRRIHASRNEACYIFDIGDHVDRSHPFTEGTNGKGNVSLLNEAGYDAVTIGNNEGITMAKTALCDLYSESLFDVIVGNVQDQDGSRPEWMLPAAIYKTDRGTKIGVIGATAAYQAFYSKLGWEVSPPRQQLMELAQQLKKETDLIVCLSHMGIQDDRLLAEECSEIDIILGAHTHHLFQHGEWVNHTLLAATGKFGEYVGRVTVEMDTSRRARGTMEASVVRADQLKTTEEDRLILNKLIEVGKDAMRREVFYNPTPLPQNLFDQSPLASFFGRSLIAYTNADCAMFNAGIFLGSLDAGWITKQHLHALLPHPINPCIITLDGAELIHVYETSLNPEWPQIEIKGLGFRGALMGAMIHERLFVNRAGQLFAGNREVVAGQKYTLATLDMFTFGYFFPTLQHAEKEYCMPELIRDVLGWFGANYYDEKDQATES